MKGNALSPEAGKNARWIFTHTIHCCYFDIKHLLHRVDIQKLLREGLEGEEDISLLHFLKELEALRKVLQASEFGSSGALNTSNCFLERYVSTQYPLRLQSKLI